MRRLRGGGGCLNGRGSLVNQPLLSSARSGLLSLQGTSLNPRCPLVSSSIAATPSSRILLVGGNLNVHQRDICLGPQVISKRDLATKAKQPVAGQDTKPAKPLDQWSAEEVQPWLKGGRFRRYALRFDDLTGLDLAGNFNLGWCEGRWKLDSQTTTRNYTTASYSNLGVKDVQTAKPLEQWSAEEVQRWFKTSDYKKYAERFAEMTGNQLAKLSKEDFRAIVDSLAVGSALYNDLQGLKEPAAAKSIQDLFLDVYKKSPTLSFKAVPNLNVTPQFLPFKDREHEIEQIAETVCANFVAFLCKSANTKDWSLTAITGGSGTGKTRFSVRALELARDEIRNHPNKYINFINNKTKFLQGNAEEIYNDLLNSLDASRAFTYYINFSNGDWLHQWDGKQEEQESAFLLTLAAKAFFPHEPVGTIRRKLSDEDMRTIDEGSVARALRERYDLGPGERVTIFIDIDEFQTRVSPDDLALVMDKVEKDRLLIRRIALTILGVVRKMAAENVHVVPIFSGTLSAQYIGVLPATLYNLVSILMPPLRSDSSIEAVREVLKKDARFTNSDLPSGLIEAMGGIGRGLEFLVQVLEGHHHLEHIDPKKVFEDTVGLIRDKYKLQNAMEKETFLWLVRYCLSGREVQETDLIPPHTAPRKRHPRASVPLATLQKDGVLFLEKTGRAKGQATYRVTMPLVFAAAFNQELTVFDPNFVTYQPTHGPEALEKFARDFEVFKTNLLVDLGETETTFGEKYYGALMSERLKARPIRLSHLEAYDQISEQFPTDGTSVKVFRCASPVNMKKEGVALWIGRKCVVCDIVYSYPGQMDASGREGRTKTFIIVEEVKSTIPLRKVKDPNLYPSRIRAEQDDASNANRVFEDEQGFEVFFHFLGNKPLPSEDKAVQDLLEDGKTMITTKAQFRDRFSPIFAPIALGDEEH